MHHRAAEDEPERVRIVRQHHLLHFGRRLRRALGWGSHSRLDCGPLASGFWLPALCGDPPEVLSPKPVAVLKIVPDPDGEVRLTERVTAALRGEDDVLPVLVEERSPSPVEVDREPERERLEPDSK